MAEAFTPSTESIKAVFVSQHGPMYAGRYEAQFDRWLAEVKAEAVREGLRLVADGWTNVLYSEGMFPPLDDEENQTATDALDEYNIIRDRVSADMMRFAAEQLRLEADALIPLGESIGCKQYEYATTQGPRKAWDQESFDAPPPGEGWELDPDRGRPGESWERFDYHEERYWRRKLPEQNGER